MSVGDGAVRTGERGERSPVMSRSGPEAFQVAYIRRPRDFGPAERRDRKGKKRAFFGTGVLPGPVGTTRRGSESERETH